MELGHPQAGTGKLAIDKHKNETAQLGPRRQSCAHVSSKFSRLHDVMGECDDQAMVLVRLLRLDGIRFN